MSNYSPQRRSRVTRKESWHFSGFVAALKLANIKLTWSISIFLLLISTFGCGQDGQTHVNKSNDPIVEIIDKDAAADFKKFVEKHQDDIVRILEQNYIQQANLPNPYKHISWHLYKSANLYIENGMGTAKIMLSGWSKSHENNYHRPVTLWFERKDGNWYLVVKDGCITTAVSSSDRAYHLSQGIRDAFTSLFPHIEYDDWYKRKEPVCKELALIRLKSALPQIR